MLCIWNNKEHWMFFFFFSFNPHLMIAWLSSLRNYLLLLFFRFWKLMQIDVNMSQNTVCIWQLSSVCLFEWMSYNETTIISDLPGASMPVITDIVQMQMWTINVLHNSNRLPGSYQDACTWTDSEILFYMYLKEGGVGELFCLIISIDTASFDKVPRMILKTSFFFFFLRNVDIYNGIYSWNLQKKC